jgi:hypothetical protein
MFTKRLLNKMFGGDQIMWSFVILFANIMTVLRPKGINLVGCLVTWNVKECVLARRENFAVYLYFEQT